MCRSGATNLVCFLDAEAGTICFLRAILAMTTRIRTKADRGEIEGELEDRRCLRMRSTLTRYRLIEGHSRKHAKPCLSALAPFVSTVDRTCIGSIDF